MQKISSVKLKELVDSIRESLNPKSTLVAKTDIAEGIPATLPNASDVILLERRIFTLETMLGM